jgi:alpha-glucosidase
LSFLPAGRYHATVWQDGEASDRVRRSERTVSSRDVLALPLSPAGGAAVILEPAGR